MDFDFVFVISGIEEIAEFYSKLGDEFRNRGYRVAFVTLFKVTDNLLQSKGFSFFNIWDLIEERNYKVDDVYQECREIEEKYQLYSLRDLVFTESSFHKGSEKDRILEAIKMFKVMEDLVNKNHIGCFVQNLGGEIYRRAIDCVAKYNNIPNVFISFAPFLNKITLITDIERNRLDELQLVRFSDLNLEEKNWVEEYIRDFRMKEDMFAIPEVPSFAPTPKRLSRLFRDFYKMKFMEKGRVPISLFRIRKGKVVSMFRARWVRRYYMDWPISDKYIFFPLHVINDSQITIRAPQFYDQEYLVRVIARSLPQGYKLCVKEHPAGIGCYPLNMLKKIIELDNVVFIPPQVNSHEIIAKSSAVMVINSTVGFESLLYYKPVIVLGEVFYKGYGVTVDVEYLFNLRKAIKKALAEKVDKDRIKSFIYSVYKASYDGYFNPYDPKSMSKENIVRVSNSIIEKLKLITK